MSELITLKLSNLYADQGFVRVTGKGNKERLAPIGRDALKHIGFYSSGVRCHLDIQRGARWSMTFFFLFG
ncbi:hypothetical protein GCM10022406_32330 [Hymenobacter algoricola]|uniref:Tyr recombinase domain-containing protein n=1 Tax=Hymenobacter algoricola TaxID=486267 RepID=A0ABP7NLJ7_9BACT